MGNGPDRAEQLSSDARVCVNGALDFEMRDAAAGVCAPAEDLLLLEAPIRDELAVSEDAGEMAALLRAEAHRTVAEARPLTLEVSPRAAQRLNILMAAGVPKRREGGVATIVYNLGREMEARGHRVTYVFLDDLVPAGSVSPRFSELIFSSRLAKYIASHRDEFLVL